MEMEEFDANTLSEAVARSIAELVVRVWPKPGVTVDLRQERVLELRRSSPGSPEQGSRCFVIWDDGQVIATSALVSRTIGTSAGDMTIAGLARVCTDPDRRGLGLGKRIVRPVFDLVDQQVFPFSLFQTSTEVSPFYETMGCCKVDNPIINSLAEDLHESPFWDRVVKRYPDGPGWPEGEIDLRGPGY